VFALQQSGPNKVCGDDDAVAANGLVAGIRWISWDKTRMRGSIRTLLLYHTSTNNCYGSRDDLKSTGRYGLTPSGRVSHSFRALLREEWVTGSFQGLGLSSIPL